MTSVLISHPTLTPLSPSCNPILLFTPSSWPPLLVQPRSQDPKIPRSITVITSVKALNKLWSLLFLSYLPVKTATLNRSHSLVRICSFYHQVYRFVYEHINSPLTSVLVNKLSMYMSEAILSCVLGITCFHLQKDLVIFLSLSSIANFSPSTDYPHQYTNM